MEYLAMADSVNISSSSQADLSFISSDTHTHTHIFSGCNSNALVVICSVSSIISAFKEHISTRKTM